MKWRNFSLGKKFFIAFNTIVVLLIISGYWAFHGIGDILNNAEQVIDGNKLRTDLESRYVDHLHWSQELNRLLTDETVTELTVQTDPHKCAFGQWYYGEGRKEAERLAPGLKPFFDQFEEPHALLHQSAIKIDDVFEQLDWEVAVKLKQAEIDHVNWMNKVKDAIYIHNSPSIDVQKDPSLCNFGKWLESSEVEELIQHHSETRQIINTIKQAHNQLHRSVDQAEAFLRNGENLKARQYYINVIEKNTNNTIQQLQAFGNWFENDLKGMAEANHIYQTETMNHLTQMGHLFDTVIEESKEHILTDKAMLDEATQTRWGVVILILLLVIIAVVLAVIITRSLLNPIKKSVQFANLVSEGDLTAIIDVDQEDEIGELVQALKNMLVRLKEIITNIKTGADNISGASQQLSSGAQMISSGVNEQAAAAEEVSSSMEEMAANIQQNTENAIKTQDISNKASKSVEQVAVASEDSMNAVKDIYSKINIVVEIAEKTDLLAINAAVEAARAGDQGRGFAVVAAEVRKLAERSQMAANEIVKLADKGMKLSEESNQMLISIVPDIQKTSQLIVEITTSSKEQKTGVDQVNGAIQQLSMVTQHNASSAEEMSSGSEELASQAVELEEMANFFKLDNNGRQLNRFLSAPAQKLSDGKYKNGNERTIKASQFNFELSKTNADIEGFENM